MNFIAFKNAVNAQFQKMQQHEMYVAYPEMKEGADRDSHYGQARKDLYERYQKAFPKGTNEIFRERPQHDCQCCNNFIRTVGNVVAIIDGEIQTIWDIDIPGQPMYQIVADCMAAFVKKWVVGDKFRHYQGHAGIEYTTENIDGNDHRWDHFYATISPKFVMDEDKIGPFLNEWRGNRDVLHRGLDTIATDAVDTVIDMLANGSLYRGDEKESTLLKFKELIEAYDTVDKDEELAFVLAAVDAVHPSIAKLRNSAIGKLLVAITNEEDLEEAVKAYEKMMAPDNYKRTTAVVTPAMLKKAKEWTEKEGVEPSLHRRHAKPTDITVANTLFTNRKAKSQIEGSVFDAIKTSGKPKQDMSKVEEVSINDFVNKILPKAESLELYVENEHFNRLVSLTAPIHADAKPILQWDNNFCWSYKGEVTDSIKERVKAAGGVVDADLCFRLAWQNTDDLDLYVQEPNGNQINFSQKVSPYTNGQLDVDMNSPYTKHVRNPVENIFYKHKKSMLEGRYTVYVNQFQIRERGVDVGFQVDMDFMGQVTHFSYDKQMAPRENVVVLQFNYSHTKGIEILQSLPSSQQSTTEWNIASNEWHSVNMMMLSPNHWDDNKAGNKHLFFILDECLNPEPVRGFYNEFLRSDFREHRKVFEMLGAVTKAPYTDQQMSGLGFSTTQRGSILARVSGAFNRVVKINF